MRKTLYIVMLVLSACAKPAPFYIYEKTNVLDQAVTQKNTCLVIDNEYTEYSKGTETLDSNPFLGDEAFSPSSIKKDAKIYDYAFINDKCENPIKLTRKIKVSGIVFPDICAERVYAGSVYTGGTTITSGYGSANVVGNNVFSSYSGTTNTYINSFPVYNTHRYACMKENYITEIEFYKDSEYLGAIRNKYWEAQNPDETIDIFTEEFLKILSNPK